jgi:hypothetical protein
MTNEARIIETKKNRKIDSIDTAQLEYTATTLFTYGTIVVSVIAVYAAVIYMGVQQLKK